MLDLKHCFGFEAVGIKNGLTNVPKSVKLSTVDKEVGNACYRGVMCVLSFLGKPLLLISGFGMQFRMGDSASGIESFFYWEFYVHVIKVLLALCTIHLSQEISAQLQVLLALSIVLLFAWSTLQSQPYQSSKLNRFNNATVLVTVLFASFRLFAMARGAADD